MTPQTKLREDVLPDSPPTDLSRLYSEGIVAGFIGAATIALWFLLLDAINGRPFYTPSLLGTALFNRGAMPASPESVPVSLDMTLMYTWVHFLAFCIIGGFASRLLGLAEKNVNVGFGILLLFVVFEIGFIFAALVLAETVLEALAWPAVLVGNLLAAASMGGYFWRHHPNLVIRP
ncbi:MAG TPA: hypothetical protein VKH64_10380 [Candidatus Binatia bacterium]|nr:hypothetical protein [Candidatus Binatia bacterium]